MTSLLVECPANSHETHSRGLATPIPSHSNGEHDMRGRQDQKRPMPNKAGFEVEDVELYFRVENPAIPEGLVSRHVFPNNYHNKALRGRAFTVRPATRYRFRPNEKYSINLRFSRSGLYLIALPADLEQLDRKSVV